MLIIISFCLIFAIALSSFKMASANNVYEKIALAYFAFTNFIVLILIGAFNRFEDVLNFIIILFLLKFAVILFLIFNRKKI